MMGKKGKGKRSKPELRLRVMTMADLDEAVRRGEITGQPLPPELLGRIERQFQSALRDGHQRPEAESVGVEQAEPADQTGPTDQPEPMRLSGTLTWAGERYFIGEVRLHVSEPLRFTVLDGCPCVVLPDNTVWTLEPEPTDQTDPVETPEEVTEIGRLLNEVDQADFNRHFARALGNPYIVDAVAEALVRREARS